MAENEEESKPITLRDLLEELLAIQKNNDADLDRMIVQSKDAEGNDFSPFSGLSFCTYRAVTTWYGEISPEELTQKLKTQGFTEEDIITDGVPAACLWPTN